jgi:hypothetical protein
VPAPAANGELSVQKLRSLWQNIRTRAEEEKPVADAHRCRATVAALDGTTLLMLRVPDPPMAEVIKRELAYARSAQSPRSPAMRRPCASRSAGPRPAGTALANGGETANGAEAGLARLRAREAAVVSLTALHEDRT